MPVAEKTAKKATKKGAKVAEKGLLPPLNITVRDCMVWPEPGPKGNRKGVGEAKGSPVYHSYLIRKDAKFDRVDNEQRQLSLMHMMPRRDDGTAIEALRGWPGSNREPENNDADDAFAYTMENQQQQQQETAPNGAKSGKGSKTKKGKAQPSKETEEEPHMGDLMQHRYFNEYMDRRKVEMEGEARKKLEKDSVARAGRRAALEKSNIKANRSSQLRAIALAEKVETSPLELWKMPRFVKGAQPHLSTGAGKQGRRGGSGDDDIGGRYGLGASGEFLTGEGCDGGGGGCLCDYYNYNTTNYVDDSGDDNLHYVDRCDELGCDSPMAAG